MVWRIDRLSHSALDKPGTAELDIREKKKTPGL